MRRGPMRWGTNEMGDQWVGGGGPMGWGTHGMSGAWVLIGGSMRWGTNEMGDQWDGEPMRWGTNEMGDQWCAPGRPHWLAINSLQWRHNGTIASQITSLTIIYSAFYSGADQKKTSKLRVTGLCAGNSPMTDEFPAWMASNAENVSVWWRHHFPSLDAACRQFWDNSKINSTSDVIITIINIIRYDYVKYDIWLEL